MQVRFQSRCHASTDQQRTGCYWVQRSGMSTFDSLSSSRSNLVLDVVDDIARRHPGRFVYVQNSAESNGCSRIGRHIATFNNGLDDRTGSVDYGDLIENYSSADVNRVTGGEQL